MSGSGLVVDPLMITALATVVIRRRTTTHDHGVIAPVAVRSYGGPQSPAIDTLCVTAVVC